MPAKKYYVIWVGQKPGIYTTWAEAEKLVKGFPNAQFKSFPNLTLAEAAFAKKSGVSAKPARQQKPKGKAFPTDGVLTSDVDIICDGACDPNPGKAGTGIAIYQNWILRQLWFGLYNPSGTNNTAELLGLYHSIIFVKAAVASGYSATIHCDSKHAIDCITTWASGWKANDWKKKGGEIKNLNIIMPAHALYLEIADQIQVCHVKGHAGVEGNELADRMSVMAIERREVVLSPYTETLSIPAILAMARG